MSKRSRSKREGKKGHKKAQHREVQYTDYSARKDFDPIEPKNEAQGHYMLAIESSPLTFATGPAGTGKTYICASMACDALMSGCVDRIVVTRPVVEAEENLGFLPGEVEDKFAPYFAPFREVLEQRLGVGHTKGLIAAGRIASAPLAYMRGRTFAHSFVILDEAQNTTPGQMKLFLTRLGNDVRVVVNGDTDQCDLPGENGLVDAIGRLRRSRKVSIVNFTADDIVRSGLAREVVLAYSRA